MNVERAEPGTPQWAELAAPHLARYLFAAERVGGRRVLDLGSAAARRLAGLAAPSVADFPIVSAAVADVYGAARFTVAICRRPIGGEAV
jgi:hypothetical protein